jgi:hypothetical protein
MGVSYDSMTYIGVYAGDDKSDAEGYLIDKGLLKEGELENKYGGDIQYMHRQGFPLNVQCENYWSGVGYYVGFETHPSSYKDFDGLIAKFKELTGDEAEVLTFEQVS